MDENKLKNKLNESLNNSIPNNSFENILSKINEKEGIITMKEPKKQSKKLLPKLSIALATIILVLGLSYFGYNNYYKVDSRIGLEVNPSIEIEVSKKEKVLKVTAKNEDAEKILEGMDLEKTDIDVALNAIIGSMVTKGYIDDLSNSILLSVENDDQEKGEQLRQRLANTINSIISADNINGSVLSQNLSNSNKEAQNLAEKYNISLGKATLILDLLESNSLLSEQDLVPLSINELNVLSTSKTNHLDNVQKEGTASTKAYIDKDEATKIALDHAGVSNPNYTEVEFDADDGLIVYEVEFTTSTTEYDYEIDATTGKIIKSERERNDNYVPNTNQSSSNNTNSSNNQSSSQNTNSSSNSNSNSTSSSNNYISRDKARQIALNHAGISNPNYIDIELDRDDNEYSVEFTYNGYEYDYEINATTGKIIKSERERID